MRRRLHHLGRDERGMSLIFVGMGFMALLAASTLAIDVGMFMTARSQSQNSADAAALSGATALVFDDYDNRTASGPAVQSAISTAKANDVMAADVSVNTSDVTFPVGPTGISNRVRVKVFRTSGRNNPIGTLLGVFFGVATANVDAIATAEASPANAMTCVKPFTIPDRWMESDGNPSEDGDIFDLGVDTYYDADSPDYQGWDANTIRTGTGTNVEPSFYWSWAMPGGTGGDWYRENIAECNGTTVSMGDRLTQEPGNMVGPTNQGVDDLIALDPNAYWDTQHNAVYRNGQQVSTSPRIFPIPLYDPQIYADGQASGRGIELEVANWVGFFVTGRSGNNIYGRITPVSGIVDGDAGPAPKGAFPKVIRLVE
jgi:Flp pilus assembly protein TadG